MVGLGEREWLLSFVPGRWVQSLHFLGVALGEEGVLDRLIALAGGF